MDQVELPLEDRGEAPSVERSGEAASAGQGDERSGLDTHSLMERVLEGGKLRRALKRVQQNKGSPGLDGLRADELPAYLKQHWPAIRERVLTGCYQPSAVRRVDIPKPGGGVRSLGIPTVLDRFIQQAMLQVLATDGARRCFGFSAPGGFPCWWPERRRRTVRAGGRWRRMALSTRHSQRSTSLPVGYRDWVPRDLNFLNRRMRTRTSGGVGGK